MTRRREFAGRWRSAAALLSIALAMPAATMSLAAEGDTAAMPPPAQDWVFEGPFGSFDRAALQRGYQVYREVCAACHAMEFIAFRNLSQPGGPEFSEEAVEALAAEFIITDGPDEYGDMFERPGKPSDYFPSPYRNDNEARAANGGALPPDLSVIAKAPPNESNDRPARLTVSENPTADLDLGIGLHYHPYFSGRQIAMAPPLFEGIVEFADGTEASVDQMSRDVASFLKWTAEPKLEERKALAKPVLIYLVLLTILLYMSYKRIWRDVDH